MYEQTKFMKLTQKHTFKLSKCGMADIMVPRGEGKRVLGHETFPSGL